MAEPTDTAGPFKADGSPGLRRSGGWIHEERLPKLAGATGAATYREMGDNDAVIGAFLYVFEMLCRSVTWRLEPAEEPANAGEAAAFDAVKAKEVAEFVESCREDMSHSWQHFVSEALSSIQYGWAYMETIYKVRRGPNEEDGKFRSKHSDGRIGWRKIDLRAQVSLLRWEYDEEQSIRGLWQLPQDTYRECFVPIEKALLFRIRAPLNNPEGRSLLRTAFRSWWFTKRLEETEAIGISRDATGMPVAEMPVEYLTDTANESQRAYYEEMKKIVQRIHRDEFEGLVLPASEMAGPSGTTIKTGFNFKLMASGGTRQIDIDTVIRRHQSRMAMTLLCEWMMLGVDKSGSYALATKKTDLFTVALGAILDSLADPMNNFGIPRLMRLNGIPQALWPKLVHGDVSEVDIAAFATAINQLVQATVLVPDEKLERKVREIMDLPQADMGEDLPRRPKEAQPQAEQAPQVPAPQAA